MPCLDFGLEVVSQVEEIEGEQNPTSHTFQVDAPEGKKVISGGLNSTLSTLLSDWPSVDLESWNFRIQGIQDTYSVTLYAVCVDE